MMPPANMVSKTASSGAMACHARDGATRRSNAIIGAPAGYEQEKSFQKDFYARPSEVCA
ncbi:hypothetical protein JANAI62_33060 [Jannaschia pagri]|uniref:Uncharacterized protein n=1 Tax=Jannaschia pagri TaxID=2829797 RepID=A0ABQ4NQJ8_9RHOB|nr:hypothetical protein JANAI61_33060 [Jannaschia sp. AI_61]GIT96683.1 hypothetical protein JANAI62_33060 [Jannaschia sp. AI_62]